MGEGELELFLPSPIFGRGAGGEGKDLRAEALTTNLELFTPLYLINLDFTNIL
jgi:hypothetical protein